MAGPPPEAVKVEGLGALVRALRQAEGDVDDLKDANQAAANIVLASAQARAPRRSGALAGSGRAGRAARKAVIRFGSTRVPYAAPIHWGWPARNIRPQPFAADAATATQPEWIAAYERDLARIIGNIDRATT